MAPHIPVEPSAPPSLSAGPTAGAAPARAGDDLLALFDRAPLNGRYWTSMALLSVAAALDFFDFYVVGYLVAVVAPQWHLTYGQSSLMLLSAGVGAIIGALVWGALSDAWGRKLLFVTGTLICAVASGAISLVPDHGWLMFTLLRFFVGFGLAASQAPTVALVVEYTPTKYRTVISSLTVVFATVGTLIASLTSAALLSALGWRGVALLGIIPAAVGLISLFVLPESVRWLVARGRVGDARKTVSGLLGIPLEQVPMPAAADTSATPPNASLTELYREPGKFWLTVIAWAGAATANYGVYLWGPTVVALLLKVPVGQAAHYFVYIALSGITGKIAFSFLPQWIGRRRCVQLHGFGIAVTLAAAGYYYGTFIHGFPAFVLLLMLAALFFDGGFSNLAPYTVEVYGVTLGARASGLGQSANGVGKIMGPLCLALIAGTSNFVTPSATEEAIFPAFLFLAACGLAIGIAASFLGTETHGRPLSQGEAASAGRIGAT